MSAGNPFSPQAWDVMLAAKSCALAEAAAEIETRHLFQGCVLKAPALVRGALDNLGLSADQTAGYLKRLSPGAEPRDTSSAKKQLSLAADAIVAQAKELARSCPEGDGLLVGPVHLWASLCTAVGEIADWLRAGGWSEQVIRGLPAAAEKQLPPRLHAPRVGMKDSELEVLNRFCHRNLTALARAGHLSPAIGVASARVQMVRCLLKRDRRSMVLTGPAGVGKTKLVEDLALGIVRGEAPELAGCELFELDLAQFTRGTHLAGSRAERWAQLTEVLRAHADDVILFIDELHTIVGLPIEGQAMDLSNVLKPLLVDDRVRMVGATTSEEYRRHIEADPALARRFTEIKVPEPDRDSMLRLLRDVAPRYETHHGVKYSAEALEAIYDLAQTYLANQSFPAKGVDLLDEVGVNVRLQHHEATPGVPVAAPTVAAADVHETLRRVWGIEPETAASDLATLLKERVIGQDHAVEALADVIITSSLRYGQKRATGPRAVILFLGPPGVGKSYMAQALSDILFPGRRTMLTLDMTEFSGAHAGEHARWRLLGPPPPYVGWENGGLLASHALQNPVSVVLIDEFDKAGPEAHNILLRVLNDGWVQDGRGRIVSFRGIYFVITANAARELWVKMQTKIGFVLDEGGTKRGAEYSDDQIREALGGNFAPELLSRISQIVLFNRLGNAELTRIASMRLSELRDSALVEDMVLVEYQEGVLPQWLVAHAIGEGDVRALQAAFERYVETPIARWRWREGAREQPVILRLEPDGNAIRLAVETKQTAGERIERALLSRVAEVFADRAERAQRGRTAGARLGT